MKREKSNDILSTINSTVPLSIKDRRVFQTKSGREMKKDGKQSRRGKEQKDKRRMNMEDQAIKNIEHTGLVVWSLLLLKSRTVQLEGG